VRASAPCGRQGAAGALDELWATNPRGALALIILLDQFPRNMFRGEARAFHSDARALSVACYALDRGWDLRVDAAGAAVLLST
jgi:uncharacterized protein (DUF924 family)